MSSLTFRRREPEDSLVLSELPGGLMLELEWAAGRGVGPSSWRSTARGVSVGGGLAGTLQAPS
jgi:hypothetical protein